MPRLLASAGLLLTGLMFLAGCSAPVGQISGSVNKKGKAIPRAELAFESTDKPDVQYFGISDEAGAYAVSYRTQRGMTPGRYLVTITHHTLPNGKPLPAGEEGEAIKTAEKAVKHVLLFEIDVAAGPNKVDFDLSQGKTTRPGGTKK